MNLSATRAQMEGVMNTLPTLRTLVYALDSVSGFVSAVGAPEANVVFTLQEQVAEVDFTTDHPQAVKVTGVA